MYSLFSMKCLFKGLNVFVGWLSGYWVFSSEFHSSGRLPNWALLWQNPHLLKYLGFSPQYIMTIEIVYLQCGALFLQSLFCSHLPAPLLRSRKSPSGLASLTSRPSPTSLSGLLWACLSSNLKNTQIKSQKNGNNSPSRHCTEQEWSQPWNYLGKNVLKIYSEDILEPLNAAWSTIDDSPLVLLA